MRETRPPATGVERLVAYLIDDQPEDPLAGELARWLRESARLRAFAETHRDKIRKKLRGAADSESRRDVRTELRVAQMLLADQRVELAFEAYGSGKVGPDFTVTVRGEGRFNLEVTRLRGDPSAGAGAWLLLAKLRQLPPSVPNAVLVAIDGPSAELLDAAAAARMLRARADARDEIFFQTRGFDGARGFYERYLRLGAVLVWSEQAAEDARATLWINRSARIGLPERAGRTSLACLRA